MTKADLELELIEVDSLIHEIWAMGYYNIDDLTRSGPIHTYNSLMEKRANIVKLISELNS